MLHFLLVNDSVCIWEITLTLGTGTCLRSFHGLGMTVTVVKVPYSLIFFLENVKTTINSSELRTESLYRQKIWNIISKGCSHPTLNICKIESWSIGIVDDSHTFKSFTLEWNLWMCIKKTPSRDVFSLPGSGRLRNEDFRLKKEVVNMKVIRSLFRRSLSDYVDLVETHGEVQNSSIIIWVTAISFKRE